ncbi:tetratricopeptide repeat protein (macronuclear) [Tetrahymena thermophila SB210]|uniref:Tetratricopeptide repeat protein n=1 Tax=Tetrahymena thermophila (strain SB210) TaxID=312017 RepID=I7MHA2_TETTS|nr:tetratricopeptide repeat protein [Tetrahymena thermophila SB210]EAS02746.2 tetratricopeptide repeat protein [Tetrahymena thermophila SB210]|eukprot:XP_001022991.2 tetratricopeptide repeat protein [Tetrahymena thermophila SB210]
MNYPKYLKDLNDLENISIPTSNTKKDNNAIINLKRKMKFNLIRNAYDRRQNNNPNGINPNMPNNQLQHMPLQPHQQQVNQYHHKGNNNNHNNLHLNNIIQNGVGQIPSGPNSTINSYNHNQNNHVAGTMPMSANNMNNNAYLASGGISKNGSGSGQAYLQISKNNSNSSSKQNGVNHNIAGSSTNSNTNTQHNNNPANSSNGNNNQNHPLRNIMISSEKNSRQGDYPQTIGIQNYTPQSANKPRLTSGRNAGASHSGTATPSMNGTIEYRKGGRYNHSLNPSNNTSTNNYNTHATGSVSTKYSPSLQPQSNSNNNNYHIPHTRNSSHSTHNKQINNQNYQKNSVLNKSMNDHYRLESAMSNLDDSTNANNVSFYEKSAPFDLNKILPNHFDTTKANDRSFDAGLNTTQNHIRTISKASTYNPPSNPKKLVSDEAMMLLEKGQKLFKENNLSEAIQCFQEALKKDNRNLELNYLLGVCYLGKTEYERAVKEFLTVMEKNPNYRKNIYLLISIAFKKLDNIPSAIRMLSKVLQNHPKYYDAYIYRGKLFIKEKKWDKAEQDFNNAISIHPEKGIAYLGKGDCLQFMNRYQEAIDIYTMALQTESYIKSKALLKRAITYIDNKQLDLSLQDLNEVLEIEPENSEAYYFKGLVYYKQKNLNEASLCFEQSIKFNNSKKAVTKSLYEIAKIKIEQRDFYEAFHTLNRSDYLDTDKKMLEKFRLFTEGVIFLMKRKYKDAIDNFNLITSNFSLGDFMKPLFYVYRAYGYFCLGKHQNALYDYMAVESNLKDDLNSQYNKSLCDGILSVMAGKYEMGLKHFRNAEKIFKQKMEPALYRGISLINMAFKLHTDNLELQNQCILNSLQEMDRAVEISDTNANLFYFRAIVRCYLGYYQEGIADIDKAIEKSEDNVPKYFYLRGHTFGICKQYKQAISDLSIAIQLDENYAESYLERAKCYHFAGESNNAFADLQKYISLKPTDPNIHKWAGNLLFNSGAYEDAIRAYSHSDQIETSESLLILRAKCSIIIKDISSAYQDVSKVIEINPSRNYAFDRGCLNALQLATENLIEYESVEDPPKQKDPQIQLSNFQSGLQKLQKLSQASYINGKIFKQFDMHLYKGVLNFYCGNYEEAIKDFNLSLQSRADYSDQIRNMKKPLNNDSDILVVPSSEDLNEDYEQSILDSMTSNQIYYNIAMAQLMMKKFSDAYDTCLRFQSQLQESTKDYFNVLMKLIFHEKEVAQPQQQEPINDELQLELLNIFPGDGKFCEIFPTFTPPFSSISNLKMRLSFDIPNIEPPSLHPVFQTSLIENLAPNMVENKPEAPWIRRNTNGVIFTDNIQVFEDLDLETEEKEKNDQDRRIEIDRMKAKLMLDKDIEDKLKNLQKKGGGNKNKNNNQNNKTEQQNRNANTHQNNQNNNHQCDLPQINDKNNSKH